MLGRVAQLGLDVRQVEAARAVRLHPVLDVGHRHHAAEAVPGRTGEDLARVRHGLSGPAAPAGPQLGHPLDVGLQVQRIAAQRGLTAGPFDVVAQGRAAGGGEEAAPRGDPVGSQLGSRPNRCSSAVSSRSWKTRHCSRVTFAARAVVRASQPQATWRTPDISRAVARCSTSSTARPIPSCAPVQIGQLAEHLVVPAQVERGQRRLHPVPVPRRPPPPGSAPGCPRGRAGGRSLYAVRAWPAGRVDPPPVSPRRLPRLAEQLAEHVARPPRCCLINPERRRGEAPTSPPPGFAPGSTPGGARGTTRVPGRAACTYGSP
ncbi:hypothetical protein STENM223S_05946 [Streptomyces tendae]